MAILSNKYIIWVKVPEYVINATINDLYVVSSYVDDDYVD